MKPLTKKQRKKVYLQAALDFEDLDRNEIDYVGCGFCLYCYEKKLPDCYDNLRINWPEFYELISLPFTSDWVSDPFSNEDQTENNDYRILALCMAAGMC